MKINEANLDQMAVSPSQYPRDGLKEVALVGRSNVGKSSFLNKIAGRKNLAYTSSKPGKTRTINFYSFNKTFRLVDLPGYGFAQVSKSMRKDWAKMINSYLESRDNLLEILLLVDLRVKPSDQDKEMLSWILDNGFSGIVIGTKADKLSKNQLQQQLVRVHKELGCPEEQDILPFSTERKDLVEESKNFLQDLFAFHGVKI